jgi:hypothetical protein
MELVDAVTTPSVGIGRKMLSRVVTSDSEKASAIDVLDPICKPEPGGGRGGTTIGHITPPSRTSEVCCCFCVHREGGGSPSTTVILPRFSEKEQRHGPYRFGN